MRCGAHAEGRRDVGTIAPPDLSCCYLCGAPIGADDQVVMVIEVPPGGELRAPMGGLHKPRVPAGLSCLACADRVRSGGAACR